MVEKFALPAAILVAAIIYAWVWRWDIGPTPANNGLMITDRWAHKVYFCSPDICVKSFPTPPPLKGS